MAMTLAEIRLKQNPILTNLLLGHGSGNLRCRKAVPTACRRLLSSANLAKLGDERLRRYNLRRAPGAAPPSGSTSSTKASTYSVEQYAVEVPHPA
jgi:hypothetical protein